LLARRALPVLRVRSHRRLQPVRAPSGERHHLAGVERGDGRVRARGVARRRAGRLRRLRRRGLPPGSDGCRAVALRAGAGAAGRTFASGRADATGFFARYSYNRLWNSLYLDFSRNLYPRGGLRVNGKNRSYDEEALTASAGTTLPLLRDVVRSATLSFSYSFT